MEEIVFELSLEEWVGIKYSEAFQRKKTVWMI
jgi:hypothetical protein